MATSAARREHYRRIAARARKIPGEHGLRPYAVAILTDNWIGEDYVGGGGGSFESLPIPLITEASGQPPKVAFDSEDPLVKPTCTIGPITPPYGGGGTALSSLVRRVCSGQEAYVRLTGPNYPNGARFAVTQVHTHKALHWTLECQHADFQPE